MKKKIILAILIIITILFLYNFYNKLSLKSSINNMIKYENVNMSTNIKLAVDGSNNISNIDYNITKSNNVYKESYVTSENNDYSNEIIKYYIVDEKIYEYSQTNNKWIKKNIKKFNRMFNINYELLKKSIKNVKKIDKNRYRAKIKAYNAYNLIYSKNILTKKDNNKYTYIYIDVNKDNLIKKISYKIDNLNMEDNENIKLNYNVTISNKNINSVKVIKLPN